MPFESGLLVSDFNIVQRSIPFYAQDLIVAPHHGCVLRLASFIVHLSSNEQEKKTTKKQRNVFFAFFP